ncbi:hypothetical protein [Nostoc sp. FACHB-888]|uniref:hypothetical protein n=1 Tax=Nostoc sp. FACHB-888 TaxID=2692842 RepID=UPI00168808DC|nr:hypothetical protein [Nostoc sp. FACHB-888]MBD2248581.1 hypothetical protein [Nostoc sp. FACHB-888]MBW4454048.1 hypothetical protein [Nostoc indistinguendum CM1-VF10]MCC5653527.1 hypothetical protein [Nostoc sp. XA013]
MIAMLIVAWIVFIILWKLLKATVSNALTAAAILILLNIGFGITPQDIWHHVTQFAENLSQIQSGK